MIRKENAITYSLSTAIANKVNEWKDRKEAILRGEAPPSEFVRTEEEPEADIYKVEEHEVVYR